MTRPPLYLSTFTLQLHRRVWTVIHGGVPVSGLFPDSRAALFAYRRWNKTQPEADVPIWHGDIGEFTTWGACDLTRPKPCHMTNREST